MNASWVTAQDFTTSELIETLRQRGFRLLDKAASDEIAASERAAIRRKFGELFSREHACVRSEYQAVIAWLDAREPKRELAGEAQREGDVDGDMKLYVNPMEWASLEDEIGSDPLFRCVLQHVLLIQRGDSNG